MPNKFHLIGLAKFRHRAILAVFCGYFGYFLSPDYTNFVETHLKSFFSWYMTICHRWRLLYFPTPPSGPSEHAWMPKSCHPDQRPKLWRGLDERWSFAFCSPLAFHTLPSVRFWCQPQSGDFGYSVRFEGRNKWDWRLRSSIGISSGYDRYNVKWYPQRRRVGQPNQTSWAQWGPEKLRF